MCRYEIAKNVQIYKCTGVKKSIYIYIYVYRYIDTLDI